MQRCQFQQSSGTIPSIWSWWQIRRIHCQLEIHVRLWSLTRHSQSDVPILHHQELTLRGQIQLTDDVAHFWRFVYHDCQKVGNSDPELNSCYQGQ